MRTTILLLGLLVTTPTLADVVRAPPALRITGVDRNISTERPPSQATFALENTTDEAVSVWIHRVVLLDGRTRIPITPSGVRVGAQDVGRTVNVPAHGTITITVRFEVTPAVSRLRTWRFELHATNDGGNVPGVATIRRMHRHPAR